jgi:hypothetical protein
LSRACARAQAGFKDHGAVVGNRGHLAMRVRVDPIEFAVGQRGVKVPGDFHFSLQNPEADFALRCLQARQACDRFAATSNDDVRIRGSLLHQLRELSLGLVDIDLGHHGT